MPGPTQISFGDPKAIQKWSGALFLETQKKSYFDRKFVGTSDNHVIQRLNELESGPGDTIQFDLSVQLKQKPTYGDQRLQGKEEGLKFASDKIVIDQMRHGVSVGGKMTRKRTAHDLRTVGKDRLSDYWAKFVDEMHFVYLSGSRGINEDFTEDLTWTGHATNAIEAPDSGHLLYGGVATSKASLAASDKMSKAVVERAELKAKTMRSTDPTKSNMLPVLIKGEQHYVCVMNEFQSYDLRQEVGAGGWLDIQKAAAAAEGRDNPIFKGGLGMINSVVLHAHQSGIRFNDYGAGANVMAGRALLLGRQAGVIAYGSSGGLRFDWTEETNDHGNEQVVASGVILGIKKTRFTPPGGEPSDFGVLSIDTAAKDPNAL
ncbi:major capsid protein, N4-gp56 family [Devosia crocina]|uniref:Major capsid protein, N4-gp56 family n=1 Tax=Devosia crocina TaxID=429728 RepID=A0A1I7N9J8_9HYPH|nr:N4-gp56 family major capsid protein [Devosia crocina]SFV31345.1 major capsid protein, N4-gp56 family [Devosia crocina]